MYDYSMDMVYSGFKFLTGVAPEPVNADRERGAKSVLVSLTWDETAKEQMDFYINRLVPDSRLDIRRCRDMNNNALAHVETVVLLQPAKCNWVKPYDCVHTVLKPADWTDRIKDFIAAGGEVIILADTEDERKSASALEGAKVVGSYDEVMSALTGQAAARVEETRKTSGEKPLRMAVYVDKGARNIGAFRWLQIATEAENVEGFPVDGAAVRAGALDKADVIVMPGGSGSREGASLGEEGREKVKAFVRGGGSYIGTCAGCYLAMAQGEGPSKNYLGLLPYRDGASGGRADIDVMFNEKAEKLAGINSGVAKIRYAGGPVPKHTGEEVEGTRVDVVATYAGDVKTPVKPNASKIGKPAALAGTCGKGRLFVFTVHPESDFDDHWIIKRALRYLAGRDVDWKRPCKSPGRTAVGLMCDGSMGVETALFAQRLLREKEFDIVPLNALTVKEGGLEEVSAVFAPANLDSVDSDAGLYGKNADRTKKFLSGGGRVFAWGNAAERARKHGMDGVTFVSGGEAALAEARRLSK